MMRGETLTGNSHTPRSGPNRPDHEPPAPQEDARFRARSSVGESSRLIIGRSQVRVLPGP